MKSFLNSFALFLSIFLLSSHFSDATTLPIDPAPIPSGYDGDIEEGSTGKLIKPVPRYPSRVPITPSFCDSVMGGAYWVFSGVNNRTLGAIGLTPMMGLEKEKEESNTTALASTESDYATGCLEAFNGLRCLGGRPCGYRSILSKRDVLASLCGVATIGTATALYFALSNSPETDMPVDGHGSARLLQDGEAAPETESDPFSFQTFLSATAGTVSAAVAGVAIRRGWIMLNNEDGREVAWNSLMSFVCCCCKERDRSVYTHPHSTEKLNDLRTQAYLEVINFATERSAAIDDGTFRIVSKRTGESEETIIIYNKETKKPSHLLVIKASPENFFPNWRATQSNRRKLSLLTSRDLESPTGLKSLLNRVMDSSSEANLALMRFFKAALDPSLSLQFEEQRPLGTPRIVAGIEVPGTATLLRFHELRLLKREGSTGVIRAHDAGTHQHDIIVLRQLPDEAPALLTPVPFPVEQHDIGLTIGSPRMRRHTSHQRNALSAAPEMHVYPQRQRRIVSAATEARRDLRRASEDYTSTRGMLGRYPERADTDPMGGAAKSGAAVFDFKAGSKAESDDGMSIAAGTDEEGGRTPSRRLRRERSKGAGRSAEKSPGRDLSSAAVAAAETDRDSVNSGRSVSRGRGRPPKRPDRHLEESERRAAEIRALQAGVSRMTKEESEEEGIRATRPGPVAHQRALQALRRQSTPDMEGTAVPFDALATAATQTPIAATPPSSIAQAGSEEKEATEMGDPKEGADEKDAGDTL